MEYRFSSHVKRRIVERHIPEDHILQLLNQDVETVVADSKADPEIQLIYGWVAGKGLVVVINSVTHVIVTARRMQKRELKYFGGEAHEKHEI